MMTHSGLSHLIGHSLSVTALLNLYIFDFRMLHFHAQSGQPISGRLWAWLTPTLHSFNSSGILHMILHQYCVPILLTSNVYRLSTRQL